jgi:hypothetical protein
MKPYQRRAARAYPYFKLAVWNSRSACWQDAASGFKRAFASEAEARIAADRPGTYRVSIVTEVGRSDLSPFVVPDPKGNVL